MISVTVCRYEERGISVNTRGCHEIGEGVTQGALRVAPYTMCTTVSFISSQAKVANKKHQAYSSISKEKQQDLHTCIYI